MGAVGAVQVHCPECDVAVPITTQITSTCIEGNKLIMSVEPDLTDVIAHAWTHEAGGSEADRPHHDQGPDLGRCP